MKKLIIIAGAGKTGSVLAKELSRYLETKRRNEEMYASASELVIFDEKKVTAGDTKEGFYLPEDRGYQKGETAAMVLSAAYPRLSIESCENLKEDKNLLSLLNSYYYSQSEIIICECSEGKAKEQILDQIMFLKERCTVTVLLPCQEGLYCKQFKENSRRVKAIREIRRLTPLATDCSGVKRRSAYTMLGAIISLLQEKKAPEWILWDSADPLTYQDKKRGELHSSLKEASLPFAAKKADIICIGAGGTGGNIVKEMIPLLLKNRGLTLTIVDGDRVEEKNLERQAFVAEDILSFKSRVLADKIQKAYPALKNRIHAVTDYIDTVDEMPETKHYPVLVGAVDNHRARQVFVRWFLMQRDALWIDSANEFSYGEVVVSIRHRGKTVSPLRSDIFPEVLTDHSPSASEISCGAINKSSPQHQLTNLVAAGIVTEMLEEAFEKKRIQGGMIYFDALDKKGVYAKRQPLYTKEVRAYA